MFQEVLDTVSAFSGIGHGPPGRAIRDGEHQQRIAISLVIQLQLKDAVSTKLKQGRTVSFGTLREGERASAGAMGTACINFKISIGVFDVLRFNISSFP